MRPGCHACASQAWPRRHRRGELVGRKLADLRAGVGLAMAKVADEVRDVVGIAHAADLLAQWEDFGRFCRDELGVEPLVLTAAFGLFIEDPSAEVRASCPGTAAGSTDVERWAGEWAGTWQRRFGG